MDQANQAMHFGLDLREVALLALQDIHRWQQFRRGHHHVVVQPLQHAGNLGVHDQHIQRAADIEELADAPEQAVQDFNRDTDLIVIRSAAGPRSIASRRCPWMIKEMAVEPMDFGRTQPRICHQHGGVYGLRRQLGGNQHRHPGVLR